MSAPPVSSMVPRGIHPPSAVRPDQPVEASSGTGNDECITKLRERSLRPAPRVYPALKSPAVHGKEVEIQTNVYGIDLLKDNEIFQYAVNIKADVSPTKEVVFTKKGKEDFVVLDRHKKCCSILSYAVEHHGEFFQPEYNSLVFDGQSMLYSTVDLFKNQSEGVTRSRTFQINGADIRVTPDSKDLEKLPCIKLEVFPTRNPAIMFSRENIRRRGADANIEAINNGYHQILELALNQACIQDFTRCIVFEHGKLFFLRPREEGFLPEDCVDVGDGKQMMPGIKKTVQFIEGPRGRGKSNPSVVIDGMKVAFHKEQLVIEKLREITKNVSNPLSDAERERCAAVMKGLDCYSEYQGRIHHVTIEGIHHQTASQSRFEVDGGQTTVADYFMNRYKIRLQFPNANLLLCKTRGNVNYFPMECMTISPNQRVQISQLTSQQSQLTTKESAVLPDVRQRIIATGKHAARISSDNDILKSLGIEITESPLMVKARQFPSVKLASNQSLPVKDNKWRFNNYLRPAAPPQVWALYAVGTERSRFTNQKLGEFGKEFVKTCNSKGIRLSPPAEFCCVMAQDIENRLILAAKSNCKFVFIITDDSITNLHQKYKVYENAHGVITQDMKMSKALSVLEGKRLTLENVVNKTNVKLGGSNYIFTDSKKMLDGTLVIGIGVSQPPPGTQHIAGKKGELNPTVVGYSYNGKDKQEFIGDFMLCPSGQDTIPVIDDIVQDSIDGYKKWHNDQPPNEIIVYRTGASDGSHGNVMAYEIPLARFVLQSQQKKDIRLVYITVSKDHTFRFFKSDLNSLTGTSETMSQVSGPTGRSFASSARAKPWDLNIPPGVSIDTSVTNPAIKQFFLNSHITLQGTAKTPLYSVLMDDTDSSMEKLEDLTFQLCHLHQVVGLSTSVPTPLYVANEYAKRGRNLWVEAITQNPVQRGDGPEGPLLKELTKHINYKGTTLFDRRVNA
ncbi:unnamed protein product [Caenorhabditis nigoni]